MSVLSRLSDILKAQLGSVRPPPRGQQAERQRRERKAPRTPPEDEAFDLPTSNTALDPQLASLYANLELPYGAPLEDVRAARKHLMKRYHPDRYGSNPQRQAVATELIKGINHAHDKLVRHLEKEQI